MKKLLLLIVTLALAGCGTDVSYTMTCDVVDCDNPTDTTDFQSGNDQAFTCTWNCACYQGNCSKYVSLTFWSWDGGCWALEEEYVSNGICGSY